MLHSTGQVLPRPGGDAPDWKERSSLGPPQSGGASRTRQSIRTRAAAHRDARTPPAPSTPPAAGWIRSGPDAGGSTAPTPAGPRARTPTQPRLGSSARCRTSQRLPAPRTTRSARCRRWWRLRLSSQRDRVHTAGNLGHLEIPHTGLYPVAQPLPTFAEPNGGRTEAKGTGRQGTRPCSGNLAHADADRLHRAIGSLV
jgi:hypothetical protein